MPTFAGEPPASIIFERCILQQKVLQLSEVAGDTLCSCDGASCCVSRFRVAGQAEAEAQQRNEQLQRQVAQLQQQFQDQGCVLADTKKQVL